MKKTALTFTAAAIALAGTAALAQGHMTRADTDGDGQITRAELTAQADDMFARMDANDDGVIDAEDRSARRMERFAAADADGDGEITQAEMQAMHEAREQRRETRRTDRMAKMFDRMDADNSGGLSQEELRAMHEARGERGQHEHRRSGKRGHRGMRGGGMHMLRMADSDGDRRVTRAEFDAALAAHFTKVDTDGNGAISAEERQAAHEAMRAERRAKRAAAQ